MDDFITLEHVTYSYPEAAEPALDDVSLKIEKGSFVAILGHNGCGKSTLAKHLNAVCIPTEGNVLIKDMDTRDEEHLLNIRRTVGMVFQNPDNQIVASVVEDDVAFAPENLGVPSADIRRRVDDALKLVGMYEFREHAPHLLSGGQKQRIAIAGVLAMQPEVLVLDEPTAMLDPSGREGVLEILHSLHREGNVTIVLITHHMEECIGCDRLIVMSKGRIVKDGTPAEIFADATGMRELELGVPETAEILDTLRDAGLPVNTAALSVEECAGELKRLLGQNH